MPAFPTAPIAPAEYMRDYLPAALAEAEDFRASLGDLDTRLGVLLTGESGGEWVVRVAGTEVSVEPGSREEAAFTLVQSVDDWRGALWEGRGGALGAQAAAVFRPGGESAALGSVPGPAALAQMQDLDGLVRLRVSDEAGADWCLDLRLGPGPIPEEPSATLSFDAGDARALAEAPESQRMSLLLQFFMAGRIRLEGDMALVMQMQAIQMQAGARS